MTDSRPAPLTQADSRSVSLAAVDSRPAPPVPADPRSGPFSPTATPSAPPGAPAATRTLHRTSRRGFLASVLAAGALAACGTEPAAPTPAAPTTTADTAALDRELAAIQDRYAVRLAVYARYRDRTVAHRAGEPIALCSTFKVYAAAAILRLESEGALDLAETVPVRPAEIVVNSPVTQAAQGTELSYAQLCAAALTRSDNTAGNLLLRRIGGPAALTAFARTVGDRATTLERWEPELNRAERGSLADTTTAEALATGYDALLLGTALPQAQRRTLTDWMAASTTSARRIRAALPPGWTAADKTGGGDFGTVNDAGVLWAPDGTPLLLALLTDSTTGDPDATPADAALAAATAAVVAALTA
ncbi:class A beta-lactamase [Nocardia sp. NPDC057353]|uniref:class A beta-lactamase n=1 Tax=Nocardia sp. NPDC057353 TaxID=3346104 RepID=UPI0036323C21